MMQNFDMIFIGYEDELLLFVRLVVGIVMIYFGWKKIKNLRSNAKDFVGMGFRPGWLWGTIVMFLEFFGGIAMLAGVFIGITALMFGFEMMLGAGMKAIKWKKPFTDYSYDLLLLALMAVLLVFGPGGYIL
jgi:uncharacterized membrane protein YphA (DoxX/SURF4 family)